MWVDGCSKELSSVVEDKDRKVIPRWRDFRRAFTLGEVDPLGSVEHRLIADTHFAEKLRDWETNRSLPFASELLGAAIVSQREAEALDAAQFIISSQEAVPPAVAKLARKVISPYESEEKPSSDLDQRHRLHELRMTLRDEPRDSLSWADLSLQYTNIGKAEPAARAMEIAMQLTPDNRFIIRSAVRFHIHKGDPDHAYHLLLRSDATESDPWLVAAEIAVSSIVGRTSDLIRVGKRMLASRSYRARHLSELASALGTLEMQSGANNRARKLFGQSLADPTENSVAQARWVYHHLGGLDLDPSSLATPRSFEARAWAFFHVGKWKEALSESMNWLSDQRFSSRPSALSSYLAAVTLQDFNEGVRLARAGLVPNPHDPVLLNNLAYALANCGELGLAENALLGIRNKKGEPAVEVLRLATSGLLEYRRGRFASGRALYLRAIKTATSANLERLAAKASLFLAIEEKRANTAEVPEAKVRATKLAKPFKHPDVSLLLDRL